MAATKDMLAHDKHAQELEERAKAVLKLPGTEALEFVKLHDAVTTMRYHKKKVSAMSRC